MTGSLGYVALGVAVAANFAANLALKRAMVQLEGGGLAATLLALLGSLAFWVGIGCAMVLLGAYLYAIRTVPLGIAYAAVTALNIALLTSWGFMSGTDPFSTLKLVGVAVIIFGFVLIMLPSGAIG